jgi:hypothetical protein
MPFTPSLFHLFIFFYFSSENRPDKNSPMIVIDKRLAAIAYLSSQFIACSFKNRNYLREEAENPGESKHNQKINQNGINRN